MIYALKMLIDSGLHIGVLVSTCVSGQLAKELKQQDCLQYAAFCNLAMARWVDIYLHLCTTLT